MFFSSKTTLCMIFLNIICWPMNFLMWTCRRHPIGTNTYFKFKCPQTYCSLLHHTFSVSVSVCVSASIRSGIYLARSRSIERNFLCMHEKYNMGDRFRNNIYYMGDRSVCQHQQQHNTIQTPQDIYHKIITLAMCGARVLSEWSWPYSFCVCVSSLSLSLRTERIGWSFRSLNNGWICVATHREYHTRLW